MGGIVMIPETVADGQWLGRDSDRIRFQVALQAEQRRLRDLGTGQRTKGVVVSDKDPVLFAAKLFAGILEESSLWLRPPLPAQAESLAFDKIFNHARKLPMSSLFVATGGTSGGLRFARHSLSTVKAAVDALSVTMGDPSLRSWCCLPLRHVAGLMQVFRAVFTGGDLVFGEYRDLLDDDFPASLIEDRLLSLVPTQLARLLKSSTAIDRLRRSRAIFVGGGALSPELAARSRSLQLPLAPTYGTTETAGMVTLLSPSLFLDGGKGVGSTLPGNEIAFGDTGTLRIRSSSLCLGYQDFDFSEGSWFETEDLGHWDEDGSFHLDGRRDRLVMTGGLKVDPQALERIICETGLADECFVTGVSDLEWGERLVAFCSPASADVNLIEAALSERLEGFQRPKNIYALDSLPLDEMGKPNASAMGEAMDLPVD